MKLLEPFLYAMKPERNMIAISKDIWGTGTKARKENDIFLSSGNQLWDGGTAFQIEIVG